MSDSSGYESLEEDRRALMSSLSTTKHTGASTSVLAIYRATGDAMGGSRRGEIPLVVSLSLNCVVVVLFSKKIASRWLVCKVSQKYKITARA